MNPKWGLSFGELIVLGLAVASGVKFVQIDRITQAPRYRVIRALNKAGGFLPYHIQYLLGCPLCLPMWIGAGLYFARNTVIGTAIIAILALRMVAYMSLRWLNDTGPGSRDWPNDKDGTEVKWPPTK